MRDAFVLRISRGSDTAARRFVGWIEEVDTGRELHFKSTDELLSFVAMCTAETRRLERRRSSSGEEPES
jgi:hypothetical protein